MIYSNINMFDCIEEDVLNVNSENLPLIILGDFNARIGRLSEDIPASDDHVDDMFTPSDFNFDSPRTSADNFVNNYGRRLISMCKNLDSSLQW